MWFICEQCGDKQIGSFKMIDSPCPTMYCGHPLSPIISEKISGINYAQQKAPINRKKKV